jgi:hypothetical protein
VAFGASARSLAAAGDEANDVAVRLERNRWNGRVEPRAIVRALCPTRPGEVRELGAERPFWERVEQELSRELEPWPAVDGPRVRAIEDRRHDGFAGVAGDLLTSGASLLVAVSDLARRRTALETLVAALAPDGLAVASWEDLAAEPELARPFEHLVALDPAPLGPASAASLPAGGYVHLCWTPSDVDFSLQVWRQALDLRPALAEVWRSLRELPETAGESLATTLRGSARYPRCALLCGRLLRVLSELQLVEYERASDGASCRIIDARRTNLDSSPAYGEYRRRLTEIEDALCAALPQPTAVERSG